MGFRRYSTNITGYLPRLLITLYNLTVRPWCSTHPTSILENEEVKLVSTRTVTLLPSIVVPPAEQSDRQYHPATTPQPQHSHACRLY